MRTRDAVQSTILDNLEDFPKLYLESLRKDFFQGGWTSRPDYPASDYVEYVKGLEGIPARQLEPEKALLIGSNMVFGAIDGLHSQILNDINRSGETIEEFSYEGRQIKAGLNLQLSNGISIRVNHPRDKCQYSYKNLYFEDILGENFGGIMYLRAVDTEHFSGLHSIDSKNRARDIRVTRKRLNLLTDSLRQLHQDVKDGNVCFNINYHIGKKD